MPGLTPTSPIMTVEPVFDHRRATQYREALRLTEWWRDLSRSFVKWRCDKERGKHYHRGEFSKHTLSKLH